MAVVGYGSMGGRGNAGVYSGSSATQVANPHSKSAIRDRNLSGKHRGAWDDFYNKTGAYAPQGGGGGGVGGGTGVGGGGVGGGGGAQMPYKPAAPRASGIVDELSQAGSGLLDPNSAYSRRLRNEIGEDIGARTAAQQRGGALRAARSGLGAGASPELLEMQGEMGREGLRATGDATAGAMLGGINLGGQLLSPALGGEVNLQGQRLQGYMNQQNLGTQQQMQTQSLDLTAQIEAARLQQEAMLRELALLGAY